MSFDWWERAGLVERSKDPRDWAPIVKRSIWQAAYRAVGWVPVLAPIEVVAESIDILCREEGMGRWRWLLRGRVLLWESVPVDHAFKLHLYAWGPRRFGRRVSFLVRVGWWRLYIGERGLSALDRLLFGGVEMGGEG